LLLVAAVLFVLGWALVFASGYGGNSTSGSELVWRIGGLMVYASLPTALTAGLLRLLTGRRSADRHPRSG
jgi:hypothetical protein